jgi:hypothetical protein
MQVRIVRALDSHLLEQQGDEEDDEALATEALQLAKIALRCLAYEKAQRATVCDILPELERMVKRSMAATGTEDTVAPRDRYDPETGELVEGAYE